ncbi:unnamed protein product [Macrosiphum euphorbiae]|uniref:HAT C-terminal dimerisation domain-containing protein n=1 Tax=Macrosiphum euphorbiae TaxID=13131 RepID=A0AAV0WJT8_9HEMI|nr:unnamed protein product [Macrosiphum euphorbiae]
MKNPIFRDVTKEAINSELDIWCTKWQAHKLEAKNVLENALGALDECHETVFPIIRTIFIIICALHISVASAERSFSTLKIY